MPFYRVLDDAPDPITNSQENSTRRRWGRGECNCNHLDCPNEWTLLWKSGEREANEYPLECSTGIRTKAARTAFLRIAADRDEAEAKAWPKADLLATGELDGTCAWETAQQAWNFAFRDLDDGIDRMHLELIYFVEFEGEDLDVEIPETHGGGRQVKVTDAGIIMRAVDFAESHGFELPPEPCDDDIDLGFVDCDS